MKFFFEITEDASQEAIQSYWYYESKQDGLEERFFKKIDETYKKINTNPEGYQTIYKNLRAAKVKNFPFQIIYEINKKTIIVYSIFNTYKHPDKKRKG